MTAQEAEALIVFFIFYSFALLKIGQSVGNRRRESREEAIRLQAYKDGRKSVIDEQNERWSMMSPELYRAMYMGIWTAPEKHETKESS
jgi:hypothetical protein